MSERNLPTNAAGHPEFASVVLTLDHLLYRDDAHVVQKAVYSTQTAEESLEALFNYYNENHLRRRPDVVEMIGRGFNNEAIYVYVLKSGVVQAVIGTPALRTVIDEAGQGSFFLGVDWIIKTVADTAEQLKAQRNGEIPPVSLLLFERGRVQIVSHTAPAEAEATESKLAEAG